MVWLQLIFNLKVAEFGVIQWYIPLLFMQDLFLLKCEQNMYNRTFSSSSLPVFILWFIISRFDVNLFRHRHFRFIIVSVHKTNLLYKMDFTYTQVVDLRRVLQKWAFSALFIGNIIQKEILNFHMKCIWKSLVKLLILIHKRSQTPGD